MKQKDDTHSHGNFPMTRQSRIRSLCRLDGYKLIKQGTVHDSFLHLPLYYNGTSLRLVYSKYILLRGEFLNHSSTAR